jgi:hypothetical protein
VAANRAQEVHEGPSYPARVWPKRSPRVLMCPLSHNVLSPRAELGDSEVCSRSGGRIKDKYNTRTLPSKWGSMPKQCSAGALGRENSVITRSPEGIVARNMDQGGEKRVARRARCTGEPGDGMISGRARGELAVPNGQGHERQETLVVLGQVAHQIG